MRKLLLAGVAAAGMMAAAGAQAAVVGSTPGGGPNPNDVFGAREGWFGANLFLIAGGPVAATLEFLGFEAGFTNTFNINGGAVEYTVGGGSSNFFPGGAAPIPIVLTPGLLDFVFNVVSTGGSVANGANVSPPLSPNFFLTFGPTGDAVIDGITAGSGTSVIIALDDGGAGPDDNHDDLVVRITLQNGRFTIPEPASMALLGMGLLGLGFAARRRRG